MELRISQAEMHTFIVDGLQKKVNELERKVKKFEEYIAVLVAENEKLTAMLTKGGTQCGESVGDKRKRVIACEVSMGQ